MNMSSESDSPTISGAQYEYGAFEQGSANKLAADNKVTTQNPPPASLLYRPLQSSEIRFIKILPGSWDEPVSCELVYVSLDDKPDYVALSYAWGDPKVTAHPMTVDGQENFITTNLFMA